MKSKIYYVANYMSTGHHPIDVPLRWYFFRIWALLELSARPRQESAATLYLLLNPHPLQKLLNISDSPVHTCCHVYSPGGIEVRPSTFVLT